MINNDNIHRLNFEDKDITLIGTAHISLESANLVEHVIEEEKPDTVCVELCQKGYQTKKGISSSIEPHACLFSKENRQKIRYETRRRNYAGGPKGKGNKCHYLFSGQGYQHHVIKDMALNGFMD